MKEKILITASVLMAIGVLLGAFGAHTLNDLLLENGKLDTFHTATQYLFYHSLGIFFIGILFNNEKLNNKLKISFYLMLFGVFLFSGSLYILSITNIRQFGIITPFGGILLVFAWVLTAISFRKN